MTSGRPSSWTPDEDAVIRANPLLSDRRVAALLPGRSPNGVNGRRDLLAGRVRAADPPRTTGITASGIRFVTRTMVDVLTYSTVTPKVIAVSLPYVSCLDDARGG